MSDAEAASLKASRHELTPKIAAAVQRAIEGQLASGKTD
jgi:hypothetical protein